MLYLADFLVKQQALSFARIHNMDKTLFKDKNYKCIVSKYTGDVPCDLNFGPFWDLGAKHLLSYHKHSEKQGVKRKFSYQGLFDNCLSRQEIQCHLLLIGDDLGNRLSRSQSPWRAEK